MSRRTAFEAALDKRRAVTAAEQAGCVVDDSATRLALMARVHSKEITLAQAQAELAKLQASAAGRGKTTRAKVYNEN